MRVLTATGNTLYYLHSDHLGSTSLTTDSGGNVTARQNYYPYGSIRSGGGMPTDMGYTGQRLDSYIKLYQMGARWYDPEIGRWLSPDTIVPDPVNPQSLNRLSYVLNNPLKYIDPTGHFEDDVLKAYLKDQWGDEWEKIWNEWTASGNWMDLLHAADWGDILRGVFSGAVHDMLFAQRADNGHLATWDINEGELVKLGSEPEQRGLFKHNGFLEDYQLTRHTNLGDHAVEGNWPTLGPNWMEPGGMPYWQDLDRLFDPRISIRYNHKVNWVSVGIGIIGFALFIPHPMTAGWGQHLGRGLLVYGLATSVALEGITPMVGTYQRYDFKPASYCYTGGCYTYSPHSP
jgi:RHS repeat-associated protein